MKLQLKLLDCRSKVLLTALCIVGLSCALPADAGASIKAIKLKQTHQVLGRVDATIADSGFRLDSTGSWRFTLVAKAPDWKVSVFRNDDKTFFCQPINKFEKSGIIDEFLMHHKIRVFNPKPRDSNFLIDGIPAKRMTNAYRIFEFLPSNMIPSPIERIIYATYKVPTCGGFPLRYVEEANGKDWLIDITDHGKEETSLVTHSARRVTVDPTLFNAPKGFREVFVVQEVTLSKSTRDAQSANFQELFGDRPDRKQSNRTRVQQAAH